MTKQIYEERYRSAGFTRYNYGFMWNLIKDMADDQIWNYVEEFIEGRISREAFWEIVKFNHPTHQIVFCTEDALKTLKFEGSDTL